MLSTYPSLMDGINRHILSIAPSLNRLPDCEVAVCTVFKRAEFVIELEMRGVKCYTLDSTSGHDFRILKDFYRVMKDFNPNIVHSHTLPLFERIVIATCFRNVKNVITIHGLVDKVKHVPLNLRMEALFSNIFTIHFDATCYISNGVRQKKEEEDGIQMNSHIVYNPLAFGDTSTKTYALHDELGVTHQTPIVGTCCRLAAVKNPVAFTEIMCKILERMPSAHAVIVGDGSDEIKATINDIISCYNEVERFHMLGYRTDGPKLVRDFNCFIMTSISEGMPTSLLECMAGKTPFAMMEGFGGLIDIAKINKEDGPIGIIVPKGNINQMADEIIMHLKKPEIFSKLTNKAYEIGKKYFDTSSIVKQLYSIYKGVCEA